jgi:hypothetical protein
VGRDVHPHDRDHDRQGDRVLGSIPSMRGPPATRRQCEFANETDPAVLKVLVKVKDGAGGGYRWVECGTCACGWQVPHYAEESVG